ncbi:hypothetical protein B0H14DRAFT_2582694 [Mycena olivaceomarginata]|nr:hypothetical protein B0H14DRAFT_2582694 [Mycena olivaceomarginata]
MIVRCIKWILATNTIVYAQGQWLKKQQRRAVVLDDGTRSNWDVILWTQMASMRLRLTSVAVDGQKIMMSNSSMLIYPATTTSPATAATFGVLHDFHLLSLEAKSLVYHFYNKLACQMDNSGIFSLGCLSKWATDMPLMVLREPRWVNAVKCRINREKSRGMIREVRGQSSELFRVLEEGSENNLVYYNTTEVQSEHSNQDRLNKPKRRGGGVRRNTGGQLKRKRKSSNINYQTEVQ